jgi:hypothetical protein
MQTPESSLVALANRIEELVMPDTNGDPRVLLATEGEMGQALAFFKGNDVVWQAP